jgi:NAD(P)-dependent dehydrogenase (short-subunit alcohol dehydrogenase family)
VFDLTGRVVVVTGGNGGIGLGMARAMLEAGASIVLWGRNEDKNAAALAQLRQLATEVGHRTGSEPQVGAFRCDVSDEQQVIEVFAASVEAMGRVDSLFANAGVGAYSRFVDMTAAEWRRVLSVNLDGTFFCLREAARHLVARGEGGSLVAVSSVSAFHGAPGMEHYASGKAAVLALMRSLAVELARHRIRCNSIVPGWTETDLTAPGRANAAFLEATTRRMPVRRWGVPDDLGPAAVFLADPTQLFHTGDALVIDGGYTVF